MPNGVDVFAVAAYAGSSAVLFSALSFPAGYAAPLQSAPASSHAGFPYGDGSFLPASDVVHLLYFLPPLSVANQFFTYQQVFSKNPPAKLLSYSRNHEQQKQAYPYNDNESSKNDRPTMPPPSADFPPDNK